MSKRHEAIVITREVRTLLYGDEDTDGVGGFNEIFGSEVLLEDDNDCCWILGQHKRRGR